MSPRTLIVGWLYADLLLVLLLAALSAVQPTSAVDDKLAQEQANNHLKAVSDEYQEKLAEASAKVDQANAQIAGLKHELEHKTGLSTKPIKFDLKIDGNTLRTKNKAISAKFRRDFEQTLEKRLKARKAPKDARAGFCLTFGYDDDIGVAVRIARAANIQARRAAKDRLPKKDLMREYGFQHDAHKISFECFLLQ